MTEKENDKYNNYPGIDYSMGQRLESGHLPNCDESVLSAGNSVNIRYGIIPVNDVLQAWADESEIQYPCKDCEVWNKEEEECSDDFTDCEPSGFLLKNDRYTAYQDRDSVDITIIKSPYFTYAQFCSPCAPGACYLRNPVDPSYTNNRTYCFGPNWFDGELDPCPYEVWEVKTGKKIHTPKPAGDSNL